MLAVAGKQAQAQLAVQSRPSAGHPQCSTQMHSVRHGCHAPARVPLHSPAPHCQGPGLPPCAPATHETPRVSSRLQQLLCMRQSCSHALAHGQADEGTAELSRVRRHNRAECPRIVMRLPCCAQQVWTKPAGWGPLSVTTSHHITSHHITSHRITSADPQLDAPHRHRLPTRQGGNEHLAEVHRELGEVWVAVVPANKLPSRQHVPQTLHRGPVSRRLHLQPRDP